MSANDRMIYRARGRYVQTNRMAWVTTVWRRSYDEARQDIQMFANNERWKSVRVVAKKYDEYLREKQKLPRF